MCRVAASASPGMQPTLYMQPCGTLQAWKASACMRLRTDASIMYAQAVPRELFLQAEQVVCSVRICVCVCAFGSQGPLTTSKVVPKNKRPAYAFLN